MIQYDHIYVMMQDMYMLCNRACYECNTDDNLRFP